ncbi:hypothetical protein [Leifsonia shinshuensis]
MPGWTHRTAGSYNVYAHPDLPVTVADHAGLTLVLLGFAIDPDRPERGDAGVLAGLAEDWRRRTELESLDRLSGRFVLFAFSGTDIAVHTDATGTRTVEYMWAGDEFHAASQALLLAGIVPLDDGGRGDQFWSSPYARSDREAFLPGDTTLFVGVDRLLPNHRLDVRTRRQERIWPRGPLAAHTRKEAGATAAAQLSASIAAAGRRFPLSLPLTAGYDSRTVLAATPRQLRNDLHVYTLLYRHLTGRSADASIPARLARRLGLAHHLIDCRGIPDDGWRSAYTANSPLAHYDDWGIIAKGILDGHPTDAVALKGNASEIARNYYWTDGKRPRTATAADILALQPGWSDIPFVAEAVERWFDAAAPVAERTGVGLDVLFYWEHRCGSWQAQSQLEWDIAQEVFTPFGNRRVLAALLGVPAEEIGAEGTELLREIMAIAEPGLLEVPFNPRTLHYRALDTFQRGRNRLKREARRLLR